MDRRGVLAPFEPDSGDRGFPIGGGQRGGSAGARDISIEVEGAFLARETPLDSIQLGIGSQKFEGEVGELGDLGVGGLPRGEEFVKLRFHLNL